MIAAATIATDPSLGKLIIEILILSSQPSPARAALELHPRKQSPALQGESAGTDYRTPQRHGAGIFKLQRRTDKVAPIVRGRNVPERYQTEPGYSWYRLSNGWLLVTLLTNRLASTVLSSPR